MSDNNDIISKRLITGTGPIGVRGIKPIQGKFTPKKCVKTVSYRGRPRYICPASGGAKAIRSLENLPVKPEDVPRRLQDIKDLSPEQAYTPSQQRKNPKLIHEALFKKPKTLHFDSPSEAGPDTEHDHLHFHEPQEAQAKDSDAVILKEDKKSSKKKSKDSGKEDEVEKGLFISEDLFKGEKGPKGKRKTKHKPPKVKTVPKHKRTVVSAKKAKHKGAPPIKPSKSPTKRVSAPRKPVDSKHLSGIYHASGGGFETETGGKTFASPEAAYESYHGQPSQSASTAYGGLSESELGGSFPGGVRELASGGYTTPSGNKTFPTLDEALASSEGGGQSAIDKQLEKENWEAFKTANDGLAEDSLPGGRDRPSMGSYSRYKYPKTFRIRSGNKLVTVDTTTKAFRDNVKRFFYTKSKFRFGRKKYDSPAPVLNEYIKYVQSASKDDAPVKGSAVSRARQGYTSKPYKGDEPKASSGRDVFGRQRMTLKDMGENRAARLAKQKHEGTESREKWLSEKGVTDRGYRDPADNEPSKHAVEASKKTNKELREKAAHEKAYRQVHAPKPTSTMGWLPYEYSKQLTAELGYDPQLYGPGGPDKKTQQWLELGSWFVPGFGPLKVARGAAGIRTARGAQKALRGVPGIKSRTISPGKVKKPGTVRPDGSVTVGYAPGPKGSVIEFSALRESGSKIANALRGVGAKIEQKTAQGIARLEEKVARFAPEPAMAGGPSRFQALGEGGTRFRPTGGGKRTVSTTVDDLMGRPKASPKKSPTKAPSKKSPTDRAADRRKISEAEEAAEPLRQRLERTSRSTRREERLATVKARTKTRQAKEKQKQDLTPEELKGDTSLDTAGSRFSKKQKAAAAGSVALFGSSALAPTTREAIQPEIKTRRLELEEAAKKAKAKREAEAKTATQTETQTQAQTQTDVDTDVAVETKTAAEAKAAAKAKQGVRARNKTRPKRRRLRRDWDLDWDDDKSPKKRAEEEDGRPKEKDSSDAKKDLEDAIYSAKKRHKEAASEDPYYSKFGIKRKISDIIKQTELGEGVRTTPRAGSMVRKSQSFVAPFVRQVANRKMSLKDALDRVPWWMQDELLEGLRTKKRKRWGR